MFRLTNEEWNRSETVTDSQKHRDPRYPPRAFTQEGVAMLSSVLRSQEWHTHPGGYAEPSEFDLAFTPRMVYPWHMASKNKELTATQQRGKKIAEVGAGGIALGIILGLLGISGSLSNLLTFGGLAVGLVGVVMWRLLR